jgi:pimeloyl-ACP methyl ester carboxylesterase
MPALRELMMGRRRLALGTAAACASVTLVACGSPAQHPTAPAGLLGFAHAVVSVPARVVHTRLGSVGYRVIGTGPPLILITGYTATMESWDPRFVGALAGHHRVVIFDNAGVGRTQPLSRPLTIDAMANQTSALISALGLGRPDVLGWSMGGTIAQALAVLHPAQVRSLVLCATFPGTGKMTPPSQAATQALTSGNVQEVMADLFPANQDAAQQAYLAAIAAYPPHVPAPATTIAAQGHALNVWRDGTDPAGQKTATISAPTLVADGTIDRLDPVANDYVLASLIKGARLKLYPDAGHAFLFQDARAFVPLIESFLS